MPSSFPDLQELPKRDLMALLEEVRNEIARRANDEVDLEVVSRRAMQELFNDSGVREPMAVAPGIVALGGQVQETSAPKHKCQLFTVFADEESAGERWAWDESLESFSRSDSAKVGNTRQSVSLHAVTEGMVMVRHRMTYDGKFHTRTSAEAWRVVVVDDDGDIIIEKIHKWVPSNLPQPHGGEASSGGSILRSRG